jgi:hypothetical protein
MNVEDAKEILREFKVARFPGLIILSFIILPIVLPQWNKLFPTSWGLAMNIILTSIWFLAIISQWRINTIDNRDYKLKTILIKYLEKKKRHSIHFLTTESYFPRVEFMISSNFLWTFLG